MIHRSAAPDVAIPDVSLPAFVLGRMAAWGDKPALIDGPSGRTLTYRGLAEDIHACAAGLAARGFGKGDVMAIYSPNLPEYAIAFYAVSLLGGTNTTINPLFTADELAKQLRDSRARYLLTVGEVLPKAQGAAEQAGIEEVFTFDAVPGTTPFDALLDRAGTPPAVRIDAAHDVAALPYSSGTTGLPKGVMLTHRNIVANLHQMEGTPWFGGVTAEDVAISVMPFFHIYGMVVIMASCLCKGATMVTLPRYELETFLEVCQRYRVSLFYIVPPMALQLTKHPAVDRYDLSALRLIFCGAAPMGEALERDMCERLAAHCAQGYGMTEASPVTHLCPDTPGAGKPGAAGLLVPNTELMIVDVASGKPLGVGQEGELWMRGPQFMKGYLHNPEATAASIDADGWYHTGDIGFVDEDGFAFVVDRVKELIKYKGYQVAPAELEALLISHPEVADAAVIPRPDEEAGEVPLAFIVSRDGKAEPEALMAWVAERVAPYKRIRAVEFVEQIPKSPSGKILRRLLVEQVRKRAAG